MYNVEEVSALKVQVNNPKKISKIKFQLINNDKYQKLIKTKYYANDK